MSMSRSRRKREKRLGTRALVLRIEKLLREEFNLIPRDIAHWLNNVHQDLQNPPEFRNKTPQELIDKGKASVVLDVLRDKLEKN